MNKTMFSIIVPIYNVEKYICQCIDSILGQSFNDFELILVDDGSPDKCGEICDKYALKDGRIKVIHKENGGLVSARKCGCKSAVGDYILNVDSDDYLADDALAELYNEIRCTNADIVCFSFIKFNDTMQTVYHQSALQGVYAAEKELSDFYSKMLFDSSKPFFTYGIHPSVCTKAIKKSIYEKYQMQADDKISIGEDLMVSLPSLCEASIISVMHRAFYFYRVNEESMTRKYSSSQFEQLIAVVKYFSDIPVLRAVGIDRQLRSYMYSRLFSIFINECIQCGSMRQSFKILNRYYDEIQVYLDNCDTVYADKKHWFIKHVIDGKKWFCIWLISFFIRIKSA